MMVDDEVHCLGDTGNDGGAWRFLFAASNVSFGALSSFASPNLAISASPAITSAIVPQLGSKSPPTT